MLQPPRTGLHGFNANISWGSSAADLLLEELEQKNTLMSFTPKSIMKTPGVMAQWYSLSERLGPKKRFWVQTHWSASWWKPYWTSATELDLWVPSACQLALLLLCSRKNNNPIIEGKVWLMEHACKVNLQMTWTHSVSPNLPPFQLGSEDKMCSPLESVIHDYLNRSKLVHNEKNTFLQSFGGKIWL
jgi:hypothetical protein